MKKLFLLFFLSLNFFSVAQSELKITTKKCIPNKGLHIKLKTVFDDSRCPENVICAWAGEVSATVLVYTNKKFIEEKTIIFNSKNKLENTKWFEKQYSKKIKSIQVEPSLKKEIVLKPKNYYLKIDFEK
ncbi:hypothetical protein [Flavobacterium sp.]|uniref:hypothetical protein n=1 Tax=Flavobacterium sp. TaxID=239 RepID=UPI00286BF6E9|nr:hypothetical protein [Flavobacterium sp.]